MKNKAIYDVLDNYFNDCYNQVIHTTIKDYEHYIYRDRMRWINCLMIKLFLEDMKGRV